MHFVRQQQRPEWRPGGASGPSAAEQPGILGAVQTRGGNQTNGDAFSPANNNTNCGSSCGANINYDKNGYAYNVDLTSSGGSLYIFDPTFCAMGSNGTSGNLGTGDHWLNGTNPVSTYYSVYDTNGTAFTTADDTLVASSGTLFENLTQSDQSNGGPTGMTNCAADAYHDTWWLIGSGNRGHGEQPRRRHLPRAGPGI